MLEVLRIQNYVLIESLEVDFHSGFNVLSGETGAGKSILVGALNLVLGARISGDVVRPGAKRAKIEAVFRIPTVSPALRMLLERHDIELEEDALILARVVTAEGRSRGYVGGSMAPLSVLSAIGDELVDLHGQHEHQSLLKADRQLALLDGYAQAETLAEEVRRRVGTLRERAREIEALQQDDRERMRRIEFLRYEVQEIDAAALSPEEEEALQTRLNRMTHAETLCALSVQIHGILAEGDAGTVLDMLLSANHLLDEVAEIDASYADLGKQLTEAQFLVETVAQDVRTLGDEVEFDSQELEELNQRRALLSSLKRKYGASVAEVLDYRDTAAAELAGLENRDTVLEELCRAYAEEMDSVQQAAAQLSKKRHDAARKLDKQITKVLQALGMKGASFSIQLKSVELGGGGIDQVAFMLTANAGEQAKPLRQVASGGEVSRIMLALKTVFATADKIPTLIFDEIDAGVGGAVARKVAETLSSLARSHQVLCITHLAQIAAQAQHHLHVSKTTEKKTTRTTVSKVEGDERERELARLLDGSISPVSLAHARELLHS